MLYIGNAWKGKTPRTWHHWNIKIPKPPCIRSLKINGLLCFWKFLGLSEENYNLQSLWITLYQPALSYTDQVPTSTASVKIFKCQTFLCRHEMCTVELYSSFCHFLKLMFGLDLEHRVWSRFWNWNLANILRLRLTRDLTIFGNIIIARTWFHSFFSRKNSEIWIAFTFFEKWKVKNKIPSLFFEKWKWNWNGSRSRTRSENEKKILENSRETRISLVSAGGRKSIYFHYQQADS